MITVSLSTSTMISAKDLAKILEDLDPETILTIDMAYDDSGDIPLPESEIREGEDKPGGKL